MRNCYEPATSTNVSPAPPHLMLMTTHEKGTLSIFQARKRTLSRLSTRPRSCINKDRTRILIRSVSRMPVI